jgi:transglutaminase-like putative cysteine protease
MKSATLILWLLLMPTIARSIDAPPQSPPSGAALLWTSPDPLIVRARELVTAGQLKQAETLLRQAPSDQQATAAAAVAESLETIRRIRQDYSLSAADITRKLGSSVRDLTAADVERWTKSHELQARLIDGQLAYFRREPSNLFRFCTEAIGRRVTPPSASSEPALIEHLKQVIDEAKRTGKVEVTPIAHRIHYTLTVPAHTPGAHAGSIVRAWLPYPQEYRQQSDVKLLSAASGKPVVADNGSPHRTLYFETTIEDPAKPVTFEAIYSYVSRAYYPNLDDSKVQPLPADFDARYLAERPPHIRFSPRLKETAAQIVGGETNPLAKARKLFHWVDSHIAYHAEEEYGIIPAISEHALVDRRGDCGVQGTLFITLCRAAGVPARWQSGWETQPNGNHNMHDWTEIYVAPWGWLPVDPSYGLKKSDDPAVREFYFGHQDSYRMIVNLDYGQPLHPAKQSLRSEPTDFQRGEVEVDGRNLYFNEFEYDFSFTQKSGGEEHP